MPLSTTQYGFIIDPMVPFTDASGTTIRNGYVRVFVAGSSTPVITFKNYDGATNEETIQLDNSGRTAYPVIVSKGNTYKVCVYDAEHSQESPILTIDKVVPAGANVEATNIVTGLDNVESPEAGWVKSTVSGTDAEVSLDATNVTSEVDTMVKATAASADYMMPLVHKAGSDPDKKITLGNIFKFVLNFIHSLTDTATNFASDDYMVIDGTTNGSRKILASNYKELVLSDVGQVRIYQGLIGLNGEITSLNFSKRCRTDLFDCSLFQTKILYVGLADSFYYRVIFYSDYAISSSNLIATDSNTNWQTEPKKFTIPLNAKGFCICVKKGDDSDIAPSDCSSLTINLLDGEENAVLKQVDVGEIVRRHVIPTGVDASSTTRCRTKFIFIGGAKIIKIKQSKNKKTRVIFFNQNDFSYIVDTPSNQNWTIGNFSVDVPSGACCFIVESAFIDDSTILTSDFDAVVSFDSFKEKDYVNAVTLVTGRITTDATRAQSGYNKIDPNTSYVCVKNSSGFKYRVVFFSTINAIYTGYINTTSSASWQTKSGSHRIPNNAVCYYIDVAKTDDSSIDIDTIGLTYFASNNSEYGKVISILGDSISTFGGSVSDPNNARFAGVGDPTYVGNRCRYPQSNLVTDVNKTYWKMLINSLGLELGINDSWAGSMVSNTSATDTGDVGPNRCISSETRIGHLGENGTPDIILVNAGTNDIGNNATLGTFNYEDPSNYTDGEIAALDVSTFADAYRAMLIRLQKTYPTARIIAMLPNYTTSYYDPQKEDKYCEIVKEACDYFGVPYIDMRTAGITIFNRSTYLPDGIHYNAAGMELIYEKVSLGFEANL